MSALPDLLGSLVAVYPHPPATEARMRAYMALLSDLSDAECAVAFRVLGNEPGRKFYPSPGEIRAAARPAPTATDVAQLFDDLEWEVCYKRHNLTTIEAKYGPVARRALVAAGGLEEMRKGGDARVWMLKRFTESYLEVQDREPIALGPVDDRVKLLTEGIGR